MTETIERFMTPSPHTIGHDQTLSVAHRIMREYGIRHLPVLMGGKLIGMLSQRDVYFIETLRDVDPEKVKVSEAMSQDLYAIGPRASTREVAREMALHKYGAAVIVDHGRVAGVFTTIDALKALSELLDSGRPD